VPHISREIERVFEGRDIVLDGELYNHDFKKDFEKIVSFVRQEEPAEGHEIVEYHIYDVVNKDTFKDRAIYLYDTFHACSTYPEYLNLVPTGTVDSEDMVNESFHEYMRHEYEGLMLRNSDGLYENKRSYNLQKVKEFDDSEFPIVDIEEGRGKLAGHAIFVCKSDTTGTTFQVKMKGSTERLKEFFDNHTLWKNKQLTVQYQGLTAYGIPRFPVGIAVRDYE
jgi:DNA ligase-1